MALKTILKGRMKQMTIRKKQDHEIIIDLTGPDGNAFYLMGLAKKYGRQMGLAVDNIIAEMKSGDYEHLLEVFEKHFGHFIILER
jgi:hypothetical protein